MCLGQARINLMAHRLVVGQSLLHELIPKIKRDCNGRIGRVFGNQLSQQTKLGRLATYKFAVAWLDLIHCERVCIGLFLGLKFQLWRRLVVGDRLTK